MKNSDSIFFKEYYSNGKYHSVLEWYFFVDLTLVQVCILSLIIRSVLGFWESSSLLLVSGLYGMFSLFLFGWACACSLLRLVVG